MASEPPQSFAAAFELRGSAEAGELVLTSPLGSTLASLVWSPAGAVLNNGAQTSTYHSLDALASAATGAPIPVRALFDWLAGQPTTAAGWQPDLTRLGEGRLDASRREPLPPAQLRLVLDR